ncbi:MAG TPA: nucleotidyltransferase family protein [Acidimicrobiales bacterium]|nr:nucleotidyltransferase family protein [Acidimicrobiales bacterium]
MNAPSYLPLDGGTALATAVAAFGLPGAPPLPRRHLADEAWHGLLREVGQQRIEGLLGAAVMAGALPVSDEQREETRETVRGRAGVDLRLERELLATTRALGHAGVAHRVLKGPAMAHTAYPDPSWRGFGDVDLLVTDGDWYRAIEVLEATGARRPVPELRPGFDLRFGKEATLLSASGWEVDLHRTLVVGPFGLWVDCDELFGRREAVTIGGVEVGVLAPGAAFLHACYNAALADDPPRLIAIRDVCELAVAPNLEPDEVADLARRWRGEAVVARALSLAADVLGVTLWDRPVAASFAGRRTTMFEWALMATYRGPARGYTAQGAGVVAVAGGRERLAYLRSLASPQDSYRAARGGSPFTHLRRHVFGARRTR